MADPITIAVAVGWAMKAIGWVASPIISKLVSKGFSYLGINAPEKLRQLELKVVQLELMLGLGADKITPGDMNRLEPLFKQLKSAFYEAEDILDDVGYHSLERTIASRHDEKKQTASLPDEEMQITSLPDKKRNTSFPWKKPKWMSFGKNQKRASTSDYAHLPPDMSKAQLKKSLEKIEEVIDEAHEILALLNLPGVGNANGRQNVGTASRGAGTPAVSPVAVLGRDEDRDKIIAMLHEDQPNNNGPCYSAIEIYGIAGSGKSTLAQHVYASEKKDKQDNKVGRRFDLVMWIHVSQKFSVENIHREMLEAATEKPCPPFTNANLIHHKLEEALRGKRFFLVLDDVWDSKDIDEQQRQLPHLLSPFKVGTRGSKILVTSRTKNATTGLGSDVSYTTSAIVELKDDKFLELFKYYALGVNPGENHDRLQKIGTAIALKLKRSPLAASIVGARLCKRKTVDFWKTVRDGSLLNETTGILWWSYQLFDEQVRRCFAYCSIFPRRHRLKRNELVNLWVAEGFIKITGREEEMEAIGQGFFDELVLASFLRPDPDGKDYLDEDCFVVHDLLHDLAENVAGTDCFRIENVLTGEIPRDVRHLYVGNCDAATLTEKIFELENLRTLIINTPDKWDTRKHEEVFGSMFKRLWKLRVLIIHNTSEPAAKLSVPESISQLKRLRYLAFQMNYSTLILPATFTKLYQMQVVDVRYFPNFQFPSGEDMVNLSNLRHIFGSVSQIQNIGRLESLETLPLFTASKGEEEEEKGYELKQLEHLNKLRGKLEIQGLENVKSRVEALEANLADKERLTELVLTWGYASVCDPDIQAEVLEGLCPPKNLESLQIWSYNGLKYPSWMVLVDEQRPQNSGLENLQELELQSCRHLKPADGLFRLFIHLCSFRLSNCSWEALPASMEHLRSLKNLEIRNCSKLMSLPTLPQSLQYFKIWCCNEEFVRSCETVEHPNYQKIQHIPNKLFQR